MIIFIKKSTIFLISFFVVVFFGIVSPYIYTFFVDEINLLSFYILFESDNLFNKIVFYLYGVWDLFIIFAFCLFFCWFHFLCYGDVGKSNNMNILEKFLFSFFVSFFYLFCLVGLFFTYSELKMFVIFLFFGYTNIYLLFLYDSFLHFVGVENGS